MRPSLDAVAGLQGSLRMVAELQPQLASVAGLQPAMQQLGALREPMERVAAREAPMSRLADVAANAASVLQRPALLAILALAGLLAWGVVTFVAVRLAMASAGRASDRRASMS
jgi:hypothetical protein